MAMFFWLFLAFVIVPIAELYVISQVWGAIGGWQTVGLLLLDSIVGTWLVRWQGVSVLSRIEKRLAGGSMPTDELVDGALIVFAGALMLTPGFLTDAVGLLLVLPPSRAVVRRLLEGRFRRRIEQARREGRSAGFGPRVVFTPFGGGPGGEGPSGGAPSGRGPGDQGDVIDLDDDAVVWDRTVGDDPPNRGRP